MKLVVVGGGSTYTPELVEGVITHRDTLPFDELCLMDIDPARLEVVGAMTRRMLDAADVDVTVTTTVRLEEALEGASFVNNLIRVGGQAARIEDERIPLRHGVIGQETTGPGGMMKALRTIPVVLRLADTISEVAPDAWLINYTNPSGIIAEALEKHRHVRFVGLCSGPAVWSADILELMSVTPDRATVDWVGLNHLGFATRITVDGHDVTDEAIEAVAAAWTVDVEWMRCLRAIPATYLQYFYHPDQLISQAQQSDFETRGERVKYIEEELLKLYADESVHRRPELLNERGGRGYSDVAFATIDAIHRNSGVRLIVQTANRGAVDGIDDDASVEIAAVVDRLGPHPIRYGSLPLPIRGLIQSVKAYESLTVAAAREQDRRLVLQAMMAHPLVPNWDVGRHLLDALAEANKEWLPWLT